MTSAQNVFNFSRCLFSFLSMLNSKFIEINQILALTPTTSSVWPSTHLKSSTCNSASTNLTSPYRLWIATKAIRYRKYAQWHFTKLGNKAYSRSVSLLILKKMDIFRICSVPVVMPSYENQQICLMNCRCYKRK